MDISLFDFFLPKHLIAQFPAKPRDASRMLVVERKKKSFVDTTIRKLPDLLNSGDVMVFNNSKVIRARLYGKKETGGRVEVFLLRALDKYRWEVLIGGNGVREGHSIFFPGNVTCRVVSRKSRGVTQAAFSVSGNNFDRFVGQYGETPTPPYIKEKARASCYQTVYADPSKKGSVAAPTAGLHFTKRLLTNLEKRGVQMEYITLHVGFGTFAPVTQKDIKKHIMHPEFVELSGTAIRRILRAKKEGRRVIAVGTTTARTLEGVLGRMKRFPKKSVKKWINPFYYPGYTFRVVDGMLTNFHLPKSTLFMLVSAFAGRKDMLRAYKIAIQKKYRFYSFGDAMLIV